MEMYFILLYSSMYVCMSSLVSLNFVQIRTVVQGFYMFKSESEIQQLLEQAGFAVAPTDVVVGGGGGEVVSGGGRCVVRREGRRCAIVKAVKLPLNDAMSAKDTTATLTVLGF